MRFSPASDDEREVRLHVFVLVAVVLIVVVLIVLVLVAPHHLLVRGAGEGRGGCPRLRVLLVVVVGRHALLDRAHRALGQEGGELAAHAAVLLPGRADDDHRLAERVARKERVRPRW